MESIVGDIGGKTPLKILPHMAEAIRLEIIRRIIWQRRVRERKPL